MGKIFLAAILTFAFSMVIYASAPQPAKVMALQPVVATSSSATEACNGINGSGGCTGGNAVWKVVGAVVSILSIIVGIASVIMIIISGFKFMTSQGESSAVASAKSSLIYALVGILIAILAQVIVRFVINRALGAYS